MPLAPAQPEPRTMPAAASSSSAWITAQVDSPSSLVLICGIHSIMPSASDDEGVIGYHANSWAPPNNAPRAIASLPSKKNCGVSIALSSTMYGSCLDRFSRKYVLPISSAVVFNSIADALPLNCFLTADSRAACSIPKISASAPT